MKILKFLPLLLLTTTLSLSLLTSNAYCQNALDFDGVNDYAQTLSNGVLGAADRTFEAWVYLPNAPSSSMAILDYGVNAAGSRNTFIINPNLGLGFISGGTNANISSTQNIIPIGQWTHVAFVLNNGTGFFYLNGNQVGTGSLSSVSTPMGIGLRIGQRVNGGSIPFKGKIDEVRIWSVAKTPQQLMANMNRELCSVTSDLVVYYRMNHGIAGGNNSGVITVEDLSNNNHDGILTNHALSGATSNWVTGATLNGGLTTSNQTIVACDSFTWAANGTTYYVSGTYTTQLTGGNANGCDSLLTLDLSINYSSNVSTTILSCSPYTWSVTGLTYNSNGFYSDTLNSSNGCDSILSLNLSINNPTTSTLSDTACDSYTWILNGLTYSTSGAYYDTLNNSNGCDSIIQLNLTINNSTTSVASDTACYSYTWMLNGLTYNTSGAYYDTLSKSNGCDSIIQLNLTINNSTTATVSDNACGSYTWMLNGLTYNTSGFYYDTLSNGNGCDSIVLLILNIDSLDNSVTNTGDSLSSNQVNASSYQWVDCNNNYAIIAGATTAVFTPTQAGNYAVIITNGSCVDTSICEVITNIEQIKTEELFTIYPNPAQQQFTIIVDDYATTNRIQIFDARGLMVKEVLLQNRTTLVNISELAMGVYFVQYGLEVKKIILNE